MMGMPSIAEAYRLLPSIFSTYLRSVADTFTSLGIANVSSGVHHNGVNISLVFLS